MTKSHNCHISGTILGNFSAKFIRLIYKKSFNFSNNNTFYGNFNDSTFFGESDNLSGQRLYLNYNLKNIEKHLNSYV